MNESLISSLLRNEGSFGLRLSDTNTRLLAQYYEQVMKDNELLHLVAPCSPEEFATRHILESLTLLEFLPKGAKFVDVGTGAGLPSIPCLLVREDLNATLIESKEKKARFLEHAIVGLGLNARANVVNRQFEETEPNNADFVTCRAIDKFRQKLPKLIKWSKGCKVLFFGGPELGEKMRGLGLTVEERRIPLSERRYLFVSKV
jgi:16S rRNA (guanine527-N7)-methyltransferase